MLYLDLNFIGKPWRLCWEQFGQFNNCYAGMAHDRYMI